MALVFQDKARRALRVAFQLEHVKVMTYCVPMDAVDLKHADIDTISIDTLGIRPET